MSLGQATTEIRVQKSLRTSTQTPSLEYRSFTRVVESTTRVANNCTRVGNSSARVFNKSSRAVKIYTSGVSSIGEKLVLSTLVPVKKGHIFDKRLLKKAGIENLDPKIPLW